MLQISDEFYFRAVAVHFDSKLIVLTWILLAIIFESTSFLYLRRETNRFSIIIRTYQNWSISRIFRFASNFRERTPLTRLSVQFASKQICLTRDKIYVTHAKYKVLTLRREELSLISRLIIDYLNESRKVDRQNPTRREHVKTCRLFELSQRSRESSWIALYRIVAKATRKAGRRERVKCKIDRALPYLRRKWHVCTNIAFLSLFNHTLEEERNRKRSRDEALLLFLIARSVCTVERITWDY